MKTRCFPLQVNQLSLVIKLANTCSHKPHHKTMEPRHGEANIRSTLN
jgi:hypothetical protein